MSVRQEQATSPSIGVTDEAAIAALIVEWSWCMDHAQWQAAGELLAEDGLVRILGNDIRGHVAWQEWADARARKTSRHTLHQVTNIRIRAVEEGAEATSMLVLYAVDEAHSRPVLELVGEYRDTCVRTASGWRFQRREVVALS